jgi:hypothetical protein
LFSSNVKKTLKDIRQCQENAKGWLLKVIPFEPKIIIQVKMFLKITIYKEDKEDIPLGNPHTNISLRNPSNAWGYPFIECQIT